MIKSRKIFITGADGFIGSHLAEHLLSLGHSVKAFILYNSFGHKGWLETLKDNSNKDIEFCFGDIRDYGSLQKSMQGCNTVFHLASLIAIPYSYQAPESYIDTNIKGTLNVMSACLQHGVEQVIHTSTSEVYGSAQYVPIDENHPIVGQSPYSASKIGADQIAISFQRSFNLPLTIIRPFNTYGPRQSARAIIPTIISQLLSNKLELKLGNLSTTRDFSFCLDTVRGMSAVLGKLNTVGEVINIGTGFEISIKELALLLANMINKDTAISSVDERLRPKNSEVERLCADNSKAKDLLCWQPEYSGIEGLKAGLKRTIEWMKTEGNFLGNYNPEQYVI